MDGWGGALAAATVVEDEGEAADVNEVDIALRNGLIPPGHMQLEAGRYACVVTMLHRECRRQAAMRLAELWYPRRDQGAGEAIEMS